MTKNNKFNLVIKGILRDIFHQWLTKRRKEKKNNKNHVSNEKAKKIILEDIFDDHENYKKVLNIMSEHKACHHETGLWMDYGKGYKSYVIAYIRTLQINGYCLKSGNLNNKQIQQIIKNSYGIDVSIALIKQVKSENIIIKFIPTAFSLN